MSTQAMLSAKDLNKLFAEVEAGLKDKSRTINSISDSKIKKLVKKGYDVTSSALITGAGGAVTYASIGVAGVVKISNIMLEKAKKSAKAILGGPVSTAITGISSVIEQVKNKPKKRNITNDRESLKQEIILKQIKIRKEMEVSISRLEGKNEELQDRLDYLIGILASLGALEEACNNNEEFNA